MGDKGETEAFVRLATQNRLDRVSRPMRGKKGRFQEMEFPLPLDAGILRGPERFRIAFDAANIGMALLDLRGNFVEVNQKLTALFGRGREELQGLNFADLAVAERESPWAACLNEVTKSDTLQCVSEGRFLHKQGKAFFAEVSYGLALSDAGAPLCLVASFTDITERKRFEAALEQQASIDPLTGALNRMRMEERINLELLRSERHGHKLSLVLVDLDHFKLVNDTWGHAAGDLVLGGFGDIVRDCLRLTDFFGRWGGEEFLILLPDTGPSGADRVAERLRAAIEAFSFPGGIRVTASLGVAGRRPGESFAPLLARADKAMYRAKQSGRNRVAIDAEDLEWESVARPGVARKLELHWKHGYESGQPIIDAEHRQLFHTANLLMSSIAADQPMGTVIALVRSLVGEIEAHFDHEEQLLDAMRYPQAVAHAEKHSMLLGRAREMAARFEAAQVSSGDLVGFVVHDVIARHLLQEDRKFFPCIKKQGARPGQEKQRAGA
jgi:diguanylate cyclase (GGDEF)-like protein/hemerythrin-like metal-binding protein/PAS domain S-box-containing protein